MMRSDMTRRAFMLDLGRGTLAVAMFGVTAIACSTDPTTSAAAVTGSTNPVTTSPITTSPVTTSPIAPTAVAWERVNLGFVSAYVLARRGEAVIVDTGNPGSEDAIEAGLESLDLGWSDVAHVIVTHLHGDHQGSLPGVMNLAADATGYAGALDIPEISSPRELVPVGDGDSVFDLEIIATPGHTRGHISVFDRAGGLAVVGDALNGRDGGVAGANPDFTDDMATANESIKKLAELTFDTVAFGHGDPVIGNASQQIADLAAGL
ncbi:MAG: MBL fold metallo-hydrolase [bacterium]|nr:MBL fold metallo-hydrolase [bacterium]